MLFSREYVLAQHKIQLAGKIIDSSDLLPVMYATVQVDEIKYYTLSDNKGYFLISTAHTDTLTLEISFVGYSRKKIKIPAFAVSDTIIIRLDQQLINIEEIVVTATRSERLLKNVPLPTQLITSGQMEALGTTNIAEIINTLKPGVDYYNEGRGMTFRMQGVAAKYTLFLIDGERIAGENRDNIDYSRLVSGNIERIELVQGASSSLYGSSAMGGVVNLITKTPSSPFASEVYSRFSKFNDLENGINIGTKTKRFSYFADAVRKSSNGYDNTPKTADLYTVEPFKIYSFFNKAVFDVTEKLQLDARASYYTRERYDVSSVPKHPFYTDFSAGLKARYKQSENIVFSTSLYRDIYNSYDILERRNNEKNRNYNNTQLSARFISDIKIQPESGKLNQHITTGIEYLFDEMFAKRIQDSVKSNNSLSFFIQDEIKISKSLSIIAGTRTDFNSEFGFSFSPKAALMYKSNNMIYRASVANGFRAPGIKERYYDFDLGFIVVKGNENLLPEKSFYTSLSAEYLTGNSNLSLIAYNNNLRNMIMEYPIEGAVNQYTYENFSNVKIYGTDLLIRSKINSNMDINSGYSFIYALDQETGKQLTGISKHSATFSLNYTKRFGFYTLGLNLNAKIYGKKDFINIDDLNYLFFDDIYETYSILKFSIINRLFNEALTINSGVDNLFNYRTHIDLINIDPGRRVFISVNIAIDNLYKQLKTLNK